MPTAIGRLAVTVHWIGHLPVNLSTVYRIAQNCGGGKLWQIDHFRAFGEENVGEFTVANSSYFFSNLEFGWVKYWQMMCKFAKFSPATILRYTVFNSTRQPSSRIEWLIMSRWGHCQETQAVGAAAWPPCSCRVQIPARGFSLRGLNLFIAD